MGKGDKKTKRGKIVIGSFGVRRPSKKKNSPAPAAVKAEPKPMKEVEEKVTPPVKAAPKKTAKKAVEHADSAEEKPKAAKARKKATETGSDTETAPEEPAQA